mmetsp:Transcript_91629/g.256044  ORF Transcript_91629/g.256044 Transcript_91629/m.256044 type:complete len:293 (-) Transcript_91629:11-889(-)
MWQRRLFVCMQWSTRGQVPHLRRVLDRVLEPIELPILEVIVIEPEIVAFAAPPECAANSHGIARGGQRQSQPAGAPEITNQAAQSLQYQSCLDIPHLGRHLRDNDEAPPVRKDGEVGNIARVHDDCPAQFARATLPHRDAPAHVGEDLRAAAGDLNPGAPPSHHHSDVQVQGPGDRVPQEKAAIAGCDHLPAARRHLHAEHRAVKPQRVQQSAAARVHDHDPPGRCNHHPVAGMKDPHLQQCVADGNVEVEPLCRHPGCRVPHDKSMAPCRHADDALAVGEHARHSEELVGA